MNNSMPINGSELLEANGGAYPDDGEIMFVEGETTQLEICYGQLDGSQQQYNMEPQINDQSAMSYQTSRVSCIGRRKKMVCI